MRCHNHLQASADCLKSSTCVSSLSIAAALLLTSKSPIPALVLTLSPFQVHSMGPNGRRMRGRPPNGVNGSPADLHACLEEQLAHCQQLQEQVRNAPPKAPATTLCEAEIMFMQGVTVTSMYVVPQGKDVRR